ncbi:hypothetical protein P7C70_g6511, partial [Phenoliferia sp. Uapishka_3]
MSDFRPFSFIPTAEEEAAGGARGYDANARFRDGSGRTQSDVCKLIERLTEMIISSQMAKREALRETSSLDKHEIERAIRGETIFYHHLQDALLTASDGVYRLMNHSHSMFDSELSEQYSLVREARKKFPITANVNRDSSDMSTLALRAALGHTKPKRVPKRKLGSTPSSSSSGGSTSSSDLPNVCSQCLGRSSSPPTSDVDEAPKRRRGN